MKRLMSVVLVLVLVFGVSAALAEVPKVGDVVTYGTYPQGAKGEVAPIEWLYWMYREIRRC